MGRKRSKSRRRLNVKLLVIVLSVLVLLAGVLAGGWYYWGIRHESRGNTAAQHGRYEEALAYYTRALHKTRDPAAHTRLLKQIISVTKQIRAPTEAMACDYARSLISYSGMLATLEPKNADYAQAFLPVYFQQLRDNNNPESWNQFRTQSKKMVAAAPGNLVWLKYAALADVVWMIQTAPEEDVRTEIGKAIIAARNALPNDGQVAFYLASGGVKEAYLQPEAGAAQARMLNRAAQIMEEYVQAHPADAEGRLNCVRVLRGVNHFGAAVVPGAAARADQFLAGLEQELAAGARPDLANEVADIMLAGPAGGSTAAAARATAFLQQVLTKSPGRQDVQFKLGVLFRQAGNHEAALTAFAAAAGERPPVVDAAILNQRNIHFAALRELADLQFTASEQATDDAKKAAFLAQAEKSLAALRLLAKSDTLTIGILEARLAMAQGRLWGALEKLDGITGGMARSPEAQLWRGVALARQGEYGEALRCLDDSLAVPPVPEEQRFRAVKEMVPLLVRLKQFDGASALAGNLKNSHPADPELSRLQADVMIARVENGLAVEQVAAVLGEVVKLLKPLADQNDPEARLRLAEIAVRLGNRQRAKELARSFAVDSPVTPERLPRLVAVEQALGLTDALAARLRLALGAPTGNRAAELAMQAVTTAQGVYWERLGPLVAVALVRSPAARELKLAELAKAAGAAAEGQEAVARAEKADPGSLELLRFQLTEALTTGKLDAADALLKNRRAAAEKMENVERLQWNAHLCLLRGDAARAVVMSEDVVKRCPYSSGAWSLLGEARRLTGKSAEAVTAQAKAVELKPDSMPIRLKLFQVLDETGDAAKALDTLRQLLVFQMRDIRVANLYLDYLARHNGAEEALAFRQKWTVINPNDLYNRRALARLLLGKGLPDLAQKEIAVIAAMAPNDRESVQLQALLEQAWDRPEVGRVLLENYLHLRGGKADAEDWLCLARYLRLIPALPDAIAAAYGAAQQRQDAKTLPVTLEYAEWQASRGAVAPALALYRELRDKTNNPALYATILDLLMWDQRHDEAARELELWRQATAPAWNSQQAMISARLLAAAGKLPQAAEVIATAIASEPNNARLYLTRAQLFYDTRDDEKISARVLEDLKKTVQLDPELIRPRELLRGWYQRESRPDEANNWRLWLLARRLAAPSYCLQLAAQYARQNRDRELKELLLNFMQKENAPVWHQMLAALYRKQGSLNEALQELDRAGKLQPLPTADGIALYADTWLAAGKPQKALELLAQYRSQQKTAPAMNILYGRVLKENQRAGEGEAIFAATIHAAADRHADLQAVIGQFLMFEKAAAVNARLERERTARNTPALTLAHAQFLAANGQPAEALAVVERLAADKTVTDGVFRIALLEFLGRAYETSQQYAKARETYEALLALQPTHLLALNNLAMLLAEKLGEPEKAVAMAEKAATTVPFNDLSRANILDTLGQVQALAGRPAAALSSFMDSLDLQENAGTSFRLAKTLFRLGRADAARTQLEQARKLAKQEQDSALLQEMEAFSKL